MFDIINSIDKLFGSIIFCNDIIREFNCECRIKKQNLPSADGLINFFSFIPMQDNVVINIISDSEPFYIGRDVEWDDKYLAFKKELYDDDELNVSIRIKKNIQDEKLTIYNLKKFSDFLSSLKTEDIFEIFTKLFKNCGDHITFQLLDTNGSLRTSSIAFSDNEVHWMARPSRKELLKKCDDASIFLDKVRIRLIPNDFEIESLEGNGFNTVSTIFGGLRTILSYIYLSNTSTIINDKVVLQFDPLVKGYEYTYSQLSDNKYISQIYDWVFNDESSVDKASIARRIINIYCRDYNSILNIDESVLSSIKSDYGIYQKNHVDQYIEMKNRISEFIVESTGKIQELSYDLADALRNNVVALLVFLMTVLLTDTIGPDQFLRKEISLRAAAVCVIFTCATIVYFIVTKAMVETKWKWLKKSYYNLKNNYAGVFDESDLNEAFNHDESLVYVQNEYKNFSELIWKWWIVLIVCLIIFTGFFFYQSSHNIETQIEENTAITGESQGEITDYENDNAKNIADDSIQ